jgi:carbonic anhydrase
LGHSQCSAILATLEQMDDRVAPSAPSLRSIVDRVRPALEPLLTTDLRDDPRALVREAVRANIRWSVNQLRHSSSLLQRLIEHDGLLVVGAEYSLETGEVEFLDAAAEA